MSTVLLKDVGWLSQESQRATWGVRLPSMGARSRLGQALRIFSQDLANRLGLEKSRPIRATGSHQARDEDISEEEVREGGNLDY